MLLPKVTLVCKYDKCHILHEKIKVTLLKQNKI
jgi:hypothetical protein